MPAVYVRMLAYAWGEPVAARTCLLGEIFSPAQAHALEWCTSWHPPNSC
jgi:enoyl-CoA hydratase